MLDGKKYRLSMTAAGLMPEASVRIAEVYLACRDWRETRRRLHSENLLQANTSNSSQRVGRELLERLKTLSDDELAVLVSAPMRSDRVAMVWVAACRYYDFLADFAVEVVRDAFLIGKKSITYEDYDKFELRTSAHHPELAEVSASTHGKIRQVVFRMLNEAGFFDDAKMLIPAMLSPVLMRMLPESNFMFFPMYVKNRR